MDSDTKLLGKLSIDELIKKANQIRKDVVTVAVRNGAGHIAPSLSCIDIITAMYYRIMNLSTDPQWTERDKLVFSKAHGCYGLYAILADLGYIPRKDWDNFYKGSFLSGCSERNVKSGIEATCGSLGHGLPIAVGMAFGAMMQEKKIKIYCVLGDGEMQEGSNWEAIQFAAKYKLSNLMIVVDKNKLQAMDFLTDVLTPMDSENDLEGKLSAFGFEVMSCNGHDIKAMVTILENNDDRGMEQSVKPRALIANTVKGYGLLCMENIPKFHFRLPTEEEIAMGNRYE